MAGYRISHLGEPEQNNDAVRLSSANDFYLRRDGTNWMRGPLYAGGFQVIRVGDPRDEQDAVNLRTLQASATSVLEQVTEAADTAVGDTITNYTNILNRDIRTKSLNLDPQGTATKNFSMGGQYHIAGLPDPTLGHEVVNLRTLQTEISQNNMRELTKYLRLDGSSEPTNDQTMSNHRLKNLKDPTSPTDAATKKYVDDLITNPVGAAAVAINADLDFSNFKVTNLKNPTDGQDAVNRRLVETNFIRKDQDINVRDHKITGLHPLDFTQNDQSDAAPKGYVDR